MKNFTKPTLFLLLLVISVFYASCSKEKVDKGIYAPNGFLVSTSTTDFNHTLAEAFDLEDKDLSSKIVSFLDVKEGFIAEVEIYISTMDVHTVVYYYSSHYKNDLANDSSSEAPQEVELRRAYFSHVGSVSFCSCGLGSFPGNGCRVSVTTNPDGSVTGTCYHQGCSVGCAFHSN